MIAKYFIEDINPLGFISRVLEILAVENSELPQYAALVPKKDILGWCRSTAIAHQIVYKWKKMDTNHLMFPTSIKALYSQRFVYM